MGLIPDLSDDVARECLLRASYAQFPAISSVCKSWKREISLPEFFRRRRACRHSQKLLVMAQAWVDPVKKSGTRPGKTFSSPTFRISVLELGSGLWTELPPVPGLPNGLPLFCRLAAVGSDLVVLGGLDPVTWQASDSVFIFSFLSSTWRLGASMPGVRRSFFGCASDSDRTVFVAGGHDEDKNALTSAISYDVAENRWVPLTDMARERDECLAIFHGGRFHVVGGYTTEEQGQFCKSAESIDISTWRWGRVSEGHLHSSTCQPVCAADENGELYACCRGEVTAKSDETWQKAMEIPADVYNVAYVAAVGERKLVVIGSARFGDPTVAYVGDLNTSEWVKVESSEKYEGHVQTACFMEL
ncbi:PREDICTED: F-box/kelch-repeat protein At1g15670-like [Tarenaya hassleriana]|uniref:F-box/kelch-repeat protein At1g15670-like n=1 Tax=Tarenaya hassleriana TaxID=28532 RepID=UPI00053C2702|nr:PREDICTED: F-box/kelch-repeat protein At1g15670-like [Tarenaya hassleriana]